MSEVLKLGKYPEIPDEIIRRGKLLDSLLQDCELFSPVSPKDRSVKVEIFYLLQSVQRDTKRPLSDVKNILLKKIGREGISFGMKALIGKMIEACEDEDVTNPGKAIASFGLSGERGQSGIASRTHEHNMASNRYKSFPPTAQHSKPEAVLEDPNIAIRMYFSKVFDRAELLAEQKRERVEREGAEDDIPEIIQNTLDALADEGKYLHEYFSFDPAVIRFRPTEQFFSMYESARVQHEEEVVELREKIAIYANLRSQLRLLLREEARFVHDESRAVVFLPETVLGVDFGSDREAIERAYHKRLKVLNPDEIDDRDIIESLHKARNILLTRIEEEEKQHEEFSMEDTKAVPGVKEVRIPRSIDEMQDNPHANPEDWNDNRVSPLIFDSEGRRMSVKYAAYLLGVDASSRFTKDDIDRAAKNALLAFDPRQTRDRESIKNIEQAKKALLLSLHDVPLVRPVQRREVRKRSHPQRKEESSRFFDFVEKPNRLIRALFGGAAIAAGGAIALHEFGEEGEKHIEEHEGESREHNDGDDVDRENDRSGETDGSVEAPRQEKKYQHVFAKKDTVWSVIVGMLRERGLSTSNVQVQYFTHKVLTDNGMSALDAVRLKPGDVIDLTVIQREMDDMAGKSSSESEPLTITAEDLSTSSFRPVFAENTAFPEYQVLVNKQEEERVIRSTSSEERRTPYGELPNAEHVMHVMQKGENPYKIVHHMLRSRGLNWTTERVNFLTQLVMDDNAERFRLMVAEGKMKAMREVWIPIGAELDFSRAIAVIDDMQHAKNTGKKAKSVRQLAAEYGYGYPIRMQFPGE